MVQQLGMKKWVRWGLAWMRMRACLLVLPFVGASLVATAEAYRNLLTRSPQATPLQLH